MRTTQTMRIAGVRQHSGHGAVPTARVLIFLVPVLVLLSWPLSAMSADKPIEYQLAVIEAKRLLPEDHVTVARFRSLLRQLSSKYVETRLQIADTTVHMRNKMREQGVEESMITIMEGINNLISGTKSKYRTAIALYYTLRVRGISHDETISELNRAMLKLRNSR